MPMIYDMLHNDHEKIKNALDTILETPADAGKTRETIFAAVKRDLEIHTTFEEKEFYRKFRDAKRDTEAQEEVEDALSEHDEVKSMLASMETMDTTSDDFVETVRALKDTLVHHISDEETEMFTQARQAMSDDEAREMGSHYQSMKDTNG